MEKARKLEAVKSRLGNPILSFPSRDEYSFRCIRPECPSRSKGKAKLWVNVRTDVFNCWVCGFAGRSLAAVMPPRERAEYLEEPLGRQAPDRQEETCRSLPSEASPLALAGSPEEAPYASYARRRGLSDRMLSLYRIMYADRGTHAGRIIVPSFDRTGSPNFFVARSIWDRKPAYMMPDASKDVIFNEHLVDWGAPVCLVEGVFDALAVGPQAIPLLGKFIQPALCLELVRNECSVSVCLDSDASREAWELAEQLLGYGIRCSVVACPAKDPSEAGPERMLGAILTSRPFDSRISMLLSRSLA